MSGGLRPSQLAQRWKGWTSLVAMVAFTLAGIFLRTGTFCPNTFDMVFPGLPRGQVLTVGVDAIGEPVRFRCALAAKLPVFNAL